MSVRVVMFFLINRGSPITGLLLVFTLFLLKSGGSRGIFLGLFWVRAAGLDTTTAGRSSAVGTLAQMEKGRQEAHRAVCGARPRPEGSVRAGQRRCPPLRERQQRSRKETLMHRGYANCFHRRYPVNRKAGNFDTPGIC